MTNNMPAQPAITLPAKALEIAISYNGQTEVPKGSNAGVFVEECLRLVGLGKGYSWCAAFTYRCFHEAALALGVKNPVPKTAGVIDNWRKSPVARKITRKQATKYNVPAGSIGYMDFGKGMGLVFIVIGIEGKTIHTVEGNTDLASGSRTGGSVCIRTRSLDDPKLLGFVVWG